MLRRMIGWISFDENETWHERGHRMKEKLCIALELFPISPWSETIKERKQGFLRNFNTLPTLTQQAMSWDIRACVAVNSCDPKRHRGRPRVRWEDH